MNAAAGSFLRARASASAALIIALFAAAPAYAQRIDEYLEPSIAGTGIEPGVTVGSRVRPEYEMQGVHLGDFLIKPEFGESVGYDSNVLGSQPAVGSPLIQTSGIFQAVSDWARNSFGISANVDNFQYTAQPRQSMTTWAASVGGTYDIGQDKLSVSATHLSLNQTSRDLDVPLLDAPIPYRINDLRLGYIADFGRFSLRPGLEVTSYSYSNGTVAGQPYLQSFLNNIAVTPNLEARYDFDPLRSLVLVLRDSYATYTNQVAGTPSLDYNDISILGGVAYTGGLLRLRGLVGYETRTYSSSQIATVSAPVVEASAIYTPTGLTTVTLNAARYIQASTGLASAAYTETVFKLRVDHEYLKNVLLSATAGLYWDQYQQGGTNQALYTAGVGATWLMNRHMRLALTYDFVTRRGVLPPSSSTQGQVIGGNYSDNRILLQLKVGL